MNKDSEEALLRDVDIIHRQLEHEDDLMVNRLSWLVASQSFLFTAYAIVLNGTLTVRNVVFIRRQDILMHLVPELGLATCGLIYLGVLAGIYVTVALRRDVKKHSPAPGNTGDTRVGAGGSAVLATTLFCSLGCSANRLGRSVGLLLPRMSGQSQVVNVARMNSTGERY
jgi:hypothetical protein